GVVLSTTGLQICGRLGEQWLWFVSGTHLSAVAAAVNALTGVTGVHAVVARSNFERLELTSVLSGSDQFVRITQDAGQVPIVYAQPIGGNGVRSWTDYGCAIGVPLCARPGSLYLSTAANLVNDGH